MRCNSCGYVLWNLRERACPECGAGFRPSEYAFRERAVRFCCPKCEQAYHGRGPKGHLNPTSFLCAGCGEPIEMDRMVLRPEAGCEETATISETMPWLDKQSGGITSRWFRTIAAAMAKPDALIRGVPEETGVRSPFLFMVATLAVYSIVGIFLPLTCAMGVGGMGGGGMGGGAPPIVFLGVGGIQALGYWLVLVVTGVIWAVATHVLLLVLGGEGAFSRTAQCVGYGSGAAVLAAIPCGCVFIGMLAIVWWAISVTIMVVHAHRVTASRAAISVLTPLAVAIVVTVGVGYVFVYQPIAAAMANFGGVGGIGGFQTAVGTVRPADQQADFLARSLGDAMVADGAMPAHIGALLGVRVGMLDLTVDAGSPVEPTIGGVSLSQLAFDRVGTVRAGAVATAIADDPIAYQVGQFVFTHRGIALDDPGELWLVVAMPPDVAPLFGPTDLHHAATLDGTLLTFPAAELEARVNEQNAVRRDAGLPELPLTLTPMPYPAPNPPGASGARSPNGEPD